MSNENILVVIVTHNAAPFLHLCLDPFVDDRKGIDIMVVDNGSTDDTLQQLGSDFPFVEVHPRSHNLGFGAANNIGLELALVRGYKGVVLLNQDAQISADTIRALAAQADKDPEIGVISPLHLSADGKQVERGFAHYLPEDTSKPLIEVPAANAAIWYVPRQTLLTVGLFCPLFFHYGEDTEFCSRLQAAGLKLVIDTTRTGIHARSESTPTPEKRRWLDYTYHLTELCSPLYESTLLRYWRGPIKLWLKGGDGKRLWRLRKEANLWLRRPPLDLAGLKRVYNDTPKAPVLLLVYNRPKHTAQLLRDYWRQPEAEETPLYILSDGAKGDDDIDSVHEVRAIVQEMAQHPMVTLWEQPTNVGLARNVTEGVSRVLARHECVIVLEDDLRLSPYLLRWMNDNLQIHSHHKEIAHIHAGTFYSSAQLAPNHLLSFAGSWGWATWRDRWESLWEPDGKKLLQQLEANPDQKRDFNYAGFMRFSKMLQAQVEGRNNSWAIRWHASILLHNKLSINAQPPMVSNSGFDGSGTHCANDRRYTTPVTPYPVYAHEYQEVVEDQSARKILRHYYTRTNNKLVKGYYKLKSLVSRR
ncbi:MAG: glycosyltransferase family 2 protein [Porphyromonas sp.]|nr:glycosyltransferase family 2 protein [Porphyromonas sp.]